MQPLFGTLEPAQLTLLFSVVLLQLQEFVPKLDFQVAHEFGVLDLLDDFGETWTNVRILFKFLASFQSLVVLSFRLDKRLNGFGRRIVLSQVELLFQEY